MQDINVPGWVVQAFVRSALDAGASAQRTLIEQTANDLLTVWAAPERLFHNTRHLTDMLTRVDTLAPETQNPCLVRLATWGHGLVFNISPEAVYSRNGGEDERASAHVAAQYFSAIGIPSNNIERISDLIMQMHKRHDVPGLTTHADETSRFDSIDVDRMALYDAHFGTLATPPQRYKSYVQQVREEYAHVPEQDWLMARRLIAQHLLARKRIFLTPLAAQWEPVARQNLQAELERIDALALCADTTTDSHDYQPPTETLPGAILEEDPTAKLFQTAELERNMVQTPAPDVDSDHDNGAVDDVVVSDVIQPHVPVVKRSSLEELDDAFTPGAPPRVLDHSQAAAARREQIVQETLETIERKQTEALEGREERE
ncbi:HD domain-containing protein [Arcanobacterium pinnipediorum]|uniref:DUF222 domain-containing protein n=1 Tax=Arcanobacterium pinnipediorum TaxID=1503041 RepID=A0ABY5AHC8_9ACTO|nr:hypothetical protein [Arcanobacterium pinnipediorum]USR79257.1 hypothetical protein NG665_07725 [Arcanobacterium pinnipediorum]